MKLTRPFLRNNFRPNKHAWKEEQSFTLSNFAGGLNNVEPDNLIKDNEAVDCKNMRFLNNTIMEKRFGTKEYDSVNFPSLDSSITWLDVFRPKLQPPIIMRGTSTALYANQERICDVGGDVRGDTFMGKYYFVDGHYVRVYDVEKNKVYKIVEEPIAHTTKEYSADGTTDLELDVIPDLLKVGDPVFILKSSLGTENNFTTVIKAIDLDSKTITVESLVKGTGVLIKNTPIFFYNPLGINHFQGEQVFDDEHDIAYYLPCMNELGDAYAGESYIPDKPTILAVHNNRIFISGDSMQPHGVYMSRIMQPLYFPVNAGVAVKPNGTEILDMFSFDGALIIGRKDDMYCLYGNSEYQNFTDNSFRLKQMDVSAGLMSTGCGSVMNNYYIYLGSDGRFYRMSTPTTNVDYLMTKPLFNKCNIYVSPINVNKNTTISVDSVVYRNEVYFVLNNGVIIVYNYDVMGFTYYTGWKAIKLMSYNNSLMFSNNTGKLMVYCDDENIYKDEENPIECNYITKRFEINGSLVFKFFKQLLITSYAYDGVLSNIGVNVSVDYISHNLQNPIPSNLSRFDNAQWNLNRFDSVNLFKSWYYQLNMKGRTIQFKLENKNINEGMRVYDINVLYTMRDIR